MTTTLRGVTSWAAGPVAGPALARAMRAMEYLQFHPLQVIARSHDLTLHSRVLDYAPGLWEQPAYQRRCAFGWGEVSFAELLLYTLRHVQEHAAQLSLVLGQKAGPAPDWEAKAKGSAA